MWLLGDAVLFSLCLIGSLVFMFVYVYFIVALSDLECDLINAQECCLNLNYFVHPKFIVHLVMVFLLIIHGHWLLVCASLPMAAWMFYELGTVPRSNIGIYDPTEILNWGQIHKHMRNSVLSMVYFLALFLLYFYSMIVALLQGNPLKNENEDFQVEM